MMRMLVAVDGSNTTDTVVAVATKMAASLGADVTVFHLFAQDPVAARGPSEDTESGSRAKDIVNAAASKIAGGGAGVGDVMVRIDPGLSANVASAILDVARELNADFVVIGHRATNPLGELLVGSVADKVIREADRPVLVAR